MEQNAIMKNHTNFLSKMNNLYIQKYFGKIQVFHDSTVNRLIYDPFKSLLEIKLVIWYGKKRYGKYKIIFKNIFEIKLKTETDNRDESVLKLRDWNIFFNFKSRFDFQYCYFDFSEYDDISKKYLDKNTYKARLFFDSFMDIELDFTDIIVIGSEKKIQKYIDLELYRVDAFGGDK